MDNDKALSMLGMARRAGKLFTGTEKAKEVIINKKAKLIIVANDTSEKTEKELKYISHDEIPVLRIKYDTDSISKALGKQTKIISICDDGFAKRIIELSTADDSKEDM